MHRLRVDLETRCHLDLKEVGGYRYAEEADIVIIACALDDGPVLTWDLSQPVEGNPAITLFNEAVRDNYEIEAHNVDFEYANFIEADPDLDLSLPDTEQLRCTAAMCRRAGIPHSLEGAGAYLNIELEKQKEGTRLINIFSKPRKDGEFNTWATEGTVTVLGEVVTYKDAWQMFVDYCAGDVEAQRQISKRMSIFDMKGAELDSFHFNIECNVRGVPFNRKALDNCQPLVTEARGISDKNFMELTGYKPSQIIKLREWLNERGYPHGNLQAKTMADTLEDIPDTMTEDAVKALKMKADASYAALGKVEAIQKRLCKDDRTRGDLTWYGAQRTGRWTSLGINIQNVKRPVVPAAQTAYKMIRDGRSLDYITQWWNNSAEAIIASTIRNFIEIPGEKILDADYSNIEGRVGAYLCGQDSMLKEFRAGVDGYKVEAASVLNKKYEYITKAERHLGKEIRLSCIFQTGARTLYKTILRSGNEISKCVCVQGVKTFREVNHKFPEAWAKYEEAAVHSIRNKEKWFDASEYVSFKTTTKGCFDMMLMRLPSGRCIIYPEPSIRYGSTKILDIYDEEMEIEGEKINFYGLDRKKKWNIVTTYGGDMFQSSVQGTARDLMSNGCLTARNAGFEIFSLIHDQALAHAGDPNNFIECLCTLPEWIDPSFPLKAEGGLVDRYSKD